MTKQNLNEKIDKIVDKYILEAGWEDFPRGWSKASIKKYAKTIGGDTDIESKEWFYKCVDKLKDQEEVDNPEELCATIKDEVLGTTKWRGEEREED